METTESIRTRTLNAEVRAVEEGHRAFFNDDGSVRVVSDTHYEKAYRVTIVALREDDPITFRCRPAEGRKLYEDDHLDTTGSPGALPCKHAALAARRLEREGLARWDGGVWRATADAEAATAAAIGPQPDDPFERLT